MSAFLRRNGFLPVQQPREGMHVKNGILGHVIVIADWDSDNESTKRSEEAWNVMDTRYELKRTASNIFHVVP